MTEDTIKQAAERAGDGGNIYYVTRYSSSTDKNASVAEVAAAQKKYSTSKPFSSMHVTGWALGKFAEDALKQCGWPCTREKLDKAIQTLKVDMGGLTGGPIEMTPTDHYGPSYWRLYLWNPIANAMEPKSGWLKKNATGYKSMPAALPYDLAAASRLRDAGGQASIEPGAAQRSSHDGGGGISGKPKLPLKQR